MNCRLQLIINFAQRTHDDDDDTRKITHFVIRLFIKTPEEYQIHSQRHKFPAPGKVHGKQQ